jgi:hypothetical protein
MRKSKYVTKLFQIFFSFLFWFPVWYSGGFVFHRVISIFDLKIILQWEGMLVLISCEPVHTAIILIRHLKAHRVIRPPLEV